MLSMCIVNFIVKGVLQTVGRIDIYIIEVKGLRPSNILKQLLSMLSPKSVRSLWWITLNLFWCEFFSVPNQDQSWLDYEAKKDEIFSIKRLLPAAHTYRSTQTMEELIAHFYSLLMCTYCLSLMCKCCNRHLIGVAFGSNPMVLRIDFL